MNWVGGVRNRLKVKNERKRQQDFFEKQKFTSKVKRLDNAKSPSKRKQAISLDLQSLQAASFSAARFQNNDHTKERSRRVHHIDLDKSKGPFGQRPFGQRFVDLPDGSPETKPSSLDLQKPSTAVRSSALSVGEDHWKKSLVGSKYMYQKDRSQHRTSTPIDSCYPVRKLEKPEATLHYVANKPTDAETRERTAVVNKEPPFSGHFTSENLLLHGMEDKTRMISDNEYWTSSSWMTPGSGTSGFSTISPISCATETADEATVPYLDHHGWDSPSESSINPHLSPYHMMQSLVGKSQHAKPSSVHVPTAADPSSLPPDSSFSSFKDFHRILNTRDHINTTEQYQPEHLAAKSSTAHTSRQQCLESEDMKDLTCHETSRFTSPEENTGRPYLMTENAKFQEALDQQNKSHVPLPRELQSNLQDSACRHKGYAVHTKPHPESVKYQAVDIPVEEAGRPSSHQAPSAFTDHKEMARQRRLDNQCTLDFKKQAQMGPRLQIGNTYLQKPESKSIVIDSQGKPLPGNKKQRTNDKGHSEVTYTEHTATVFQDSGVRTEMNKDRMLATLEQSSITQDQLHASAAEMSDAHEVLSKKHEVTRDSPLLASSASLKTTKIQTSTGHESIQHVINIGDSSDSDIGDDCTESSHSSRFSSIAVSTDDDESSQQQHPDGACAASNWLGFVTGTQAQARNEVGVETFSNQRSEVTNKTKFSASVIAQQMLEEVLALDRELQKDNPKGDNEFCMSPGSMSNMGKEQFSDGRGTFSELESLKEISGPASLPSQSDTAQDTEQKVTETTALDKGCYKGVTEKLRIQLQDLPKETADNSKTLAGQRETNPTALQTKYFQEIGIQTELPRCTMSNGQTPDTSSNLRASSPELPARPTLRDSSMQTEMLPDTNTDVVPDAGDPSGVVSPDVPTSTSGEASIAAANVGSKVVCDVSAQCMLIGEPLSEPGESQFGTREQDVCHSSCDKEGLRSLNSEADTDTCDSVLLLSSQEDAFDSCLSTQP